MFSLKKIFGMIAGLASANAFAAQMDPSGVLEFIFKIFIAAKYLAPLAILLLAGFTLYKSRGAALGFLIYLVGFSYVSIIDRREAEQKKANFQQQTEIWNQSCMLEAGESGQPLTFPLKKGIVYLDPRLQKHWYSSRFKVTKSTELIEITSSKPSNLNDNEVLVEISIFDKSDDKASRYIRQGIQTKVFDSAGQILAQRVNFIVVSDNCLQEPEDQGIERFLRRILGVEKVVFESFSDQEKVIPTSYVVAKVTGIETGRFAANPNILSGKLPAIIPSEWRCKFDKGIGGPDLIKCPNPNNELVYERKLQHAWAVHRLKDGNWLVVSHPLLNGMVLGRLVLDVRTPEGHSVQRVNVRFPAIKELRLNLGDVQVFADRVELILLKHRTGELPKTEAPPQYQERFQISIPIAHMSRDQALHQVSFTSFSQLSVEPQVTQKNRRHALAWRPH